MLWFKHDANANADSKLQNVLLDYGLEGYGLYWYCIELITGKVDVNNITFQLEHDARIIARNTGSTPQKVEEMMRYFVKIGLFENSNGIITCMKIAKRLDQSMTSNKAMREIIERIKSGNHDGVMTASCQSHAVVMQEEIRRDKSRVDTHGESDDSQPVKDVQQKKGSRLSAEWQIPDDWITWATKQGIASQAARFEADKFRDFWIAKPGQGGVKSDWQATWRNWIRNVISRDPKIAQQQQQSKRPRAFGE